jgi:hypothetical protein
MSTMNQPGFTATVSLYKSSGRYQTRRHVMMTSAIYPALARGPLGETECSDSCCANCTCCANGTGPNPTACCDYCNSNCKAKVTGGFGVGGGRFIG